MEDKSILLKLPYGELSIAAIKKELSDRKVCVADENEMLKADLSECLRRALEKTQSLGSLIQLRAYEIDAIQHARKDTLAAKLRSRGLAMLQDSKEGDRDFLLQRLHQELCNEKADFERQNKENIPPQEHGEGEKGPNKPPSAITPEGRERAERNRKRALEIQTEHRQDHKQQRTDTGPAVSITPIRVPPRELSHSIELSDDDESTPIPFDYCTPIKTNTLNPYATLKRTGFKSPFSHIYSPVVPTKLHTSEGQRKSAFTPSLPLHNRNKDSKNPCSRCGDTCGRQKLCLVWNHEGDVQREIVSLGYDRFRWDCCGRLDGQPCFVGPHSRGSSQAAPRMVLCHCRDAAILKRTRKYTSPNRGRYFFKCRTCKFFRWADEAYGVEKDVPLVAPDGVREWEVPFANPYAEKRILVTDPASTKRKRLIAALLLQELCSSVQGQGSGLNCNGICSKELAASLLQTVHSGGDAILWRLQPLTSDQVARRFGWPKATTLADLEGRECEEVLLDMLDHSPLIRSIGIRYQRAGPVGEGDSSVFLDLSGLEGYIHA